MNVLLKNNSLSEDDSIRLAKSFFSSAPQRIEKKVFSQKIIFIFAALVALSLIGFFFLRNFNVIILPEYKQASANKAVGLLADYDNVTLTLIKPQRNAQILKHAIYLNLPFNQKSGFSLNFKEKQDLTNSRLVLLAKNPQQDLQMDVILRDARYNSNLQKPITLEIPKSIVKTAYLEIPVDINKTSFGNKPINLTRIGQVRFIFSQQKEALLPLLVKNVFVQKEVK